MSLSGLLTIEAASPITQLKRYQLNPFLALFGSHMRPCSKMTDFKRRAGAEINI